MTRQLERLRPHEIRAELAQHSLIWLPLGTIEWHCEHLPVGLDALTAHGLCLAAAHRAGGLVMPPLYFGTGGGHGAYPWTIMMPGPEQIDVLLARTAERLQAMKVERLVIFSGHFAEEQLQMIDRFSEVWNASGAKPRITATAVNRCAAAGMDPDHAGAFETVLMHAIAPETVDLSCLPALVEAPDTYDRHDPESPIWGVIGKDPRTVDLAQGSALLERMTDWLSRQST
ncbi:Creatinine amidohydrolase [Aquimixticola soesokkakensis]|uniref:Creatinine amidohydrolase n=2 Tax=Aquimixticola soesokkakensis TaxID=1519096 RepID=A0A1Y5THT9_9RHOB|nr:Creatinine amidohydrolase [Aquimixticola soesokkakensis]